VKYVAVRAGRLIDGLGGPPMTDAMIPIENDAIKRALRAGVLSIEHASLVDEEGLALAKERGAWLVSELERGSFVMKGGVVYKRNPVR
jgi:hypothetical protein